VFDVLNQVIIVPCVDKKTPLPETKSSAPSNTIDACFPIPENVGPFIKDPEVLFPDISLQVVPVPGY